ncbi:D-amino-acid transaminase [Phaeobacter sp. B1627]|uniref:D-amino-acid transaminase n=1 Tax=Phaeobacter sp. B1627 TaxID=2583809 RepID=UPI001118736B|nr:D-amino-acid transaminase [Phaeobacter sp. B1627]TNJ43302.1 D-amino-acid transaminase [Phaeobacter sp. B1627]
MRTVFVNGVYLPEDQAQISIFDRGFLFGDAVYEVTAVMNGKLVDFDAHMDRLARSMAELDMVRGYERSALLTIHKNLIKRNNLQEGLVYLQLTRGAADRDFDFSDLDVAPGLVLFTQAKSLEVNPLAARGQKIVLADDLRWGRSDIKTVQLLYASLMKTRAKRQGADDVWLCRDGKITEGSSNNAYIVTRHNEIITRALSTDILHGITRAAVLKIAELHQLKVIERAFSVDELKDAKEAFSTSASGFVNPVVTVDGADIGDGQPGQIASALRSSYVSASQAAAC